MLAAWAEPSFERDLESVEGGFPAGGPAFAAGAGRIQAHHYQVDTLERGLLVGEVPAGAHSPADAADPNRVLGLSALRACCVWHRALVPQVGGMRDAEPGQSPGATRARLRSLSGLCWCRSRSDRLRVPQPTYERGLRQVVSSPKKTLTCTETRVETIPAFARHDLTDEQWAALEPLLPVGKKPGRRRSTPNAG